MKDRLFIFTKRVLPLSHTFVAAPANRLETLQPVFTGFTREQSGEYLLKDAPVCILEDWEKHPRWAKFLLERWGRISDGWLKALASYKPKMIHAHSGKVGFYAGPISQALDIPLAVTFHGSDITQRNRFSYNQKHRNQVYRDAHLIIAASKFIYQRLLENGCPQKKLRQHYTGIDTQFFRPSGIKNDIPTILFVGKLIKQKGCDYLLRAMSKVNRLVPDAQLLIVGDGVERKSLQAQARKLENVEFLGSQEREQVKLLMESAWVMCAPSIRLGRGNEEGLGMVFLEAQAVGTPVVSFDTGGVVEAVSHGETGFTVREKSTEALCETLVNLLQSKQLRDAMGKAGIAHVAQNFDLTKQTIQLERMYRHLIKQ